MWRVRTMGRGEAAKRLAMAASQCSLPRCTCTTSASGSQPSSARRSRASLAACTPLRNASVATRPTPIARARSITRASLPALQTSVVGCPARSSSALMHAAQYASDDQPRHDMRCSILTRRTLSGSALTSGRAGPGAAGRSPPSAPRAARGCVARWPGGAPPHPWPAPRPGSATSARRASRHRFGMIVPHEQPGAPVDHRLRERADGARDDRTTRRHRLERRAAGFVGPRGHQGEHVERVEHRGKVAVAVAGEDDPAGEALIAHEGLDGVPALPLADQHEPRLGKLARGGARSRGSGARGRDWRRGARRSRSPAPRPSPSSWRTLLAPAALGEALDLHDAVDAEERARGQARGAAAPLDLGAHRDRAIGAVDRARGPASGATPSAHCETSARGRRARGTAGPASDRGSDGSGRRPLARSARGAGGASRRAGAPRGSTRASRDKPGTGAIPASRALSSKRAPGMSPSRTRWPRAPSPRTSWMTGSALPVHQRLATRCSTTSGRAAFMRRAAASGPPPPGARRRARAAG